MPDTNRLDFTIPRRSIEQGLFDQALQKVKDLQNTIKSSHPDWAECEALRKEIQVKKKQSRPATVVSLKPNLPRASFPGLLANDAERITLTGYSDFNIIGLFSPNDETLSDVDAVWVANFRQGKATVWAACLQGSSAYSSDPAWTPVASESELLNELLKHLDGGASFFWDSSRVLALLQNWHYRAKGEELPATLPLVDLSGLCRVAFPLAHRTDFPESICKQLGLSFLDDKGNGGPLAAMCALFKECHAKLKSLPESQRFALREVFSFKPKAKDLEDKEGKTNKKGCFPVLTKKWIDVFLPEPKDKNIDGYLNQLAERFTKLSLPIKKSVGVRGEVTVDVNDFLREGGFLEKVLDGKYNKRADQIGFSQKAEEAFTSDCPYVLEAGTGIGKTIGYLIPALLSGKRAYISTHTKALQDQAWSKDVPLVLKALSLAKIERTVTVIKGKSNYACLQTLEDWLSNPSEFIRNPEDVFFIAAVVNWVFITETGWLSEIEHLGNWRLSHLLGRNEAPPKLRDRWAEIDPHARAKEAADKADIVLANHSYVFAMAQVEEQPQHKPEILILDEAHNVDEVVTETLAKRFKPMSMRREIESLLKRDSKSEPQGLFRALLKHPQIASLPVLNDFSIKLLRVEGVLATYCAAVYARINEMYEDLEDRDPELSLCFPAKDFWVDPLYESAKSLLADLESLSAAAHNLSENIQTIKGLPLRAQGALLALEEHLNSDIEALKALFETDEDFVHWGEARASEGANGEKLDWAVELHNTPLNIAGWLKEYINTKFKHRLYVSATMSISADFSSICERLGLNTDEEGNKPVTSIYPSLFDYKKQALLGVPHDLSEPSQRAEDDVVYLDEQSRHISELAKISNGCMLVLFTSRRVMRGIGIRLKTHLSESGIIVISQEDAGRAALIDRLRDAPDKGEKIVLLGLRAFWEGVDIPGKALSVLVITRLPFDYHGHPVAQAKQAFFERTHHDADYFGQRVLPQTFIHLRQMYGRLIRDEKDRGCTVITDRRIYIRRYGKNLLERLPESNVVVNTGAVVASCVKDFLDGKEVKSTFVWGGLIIHNFKLSPEQDAIVKSQSKRILIRASAGSGKTRVLVAKLISAIEKDSANPENILALTFTNKAVEVMASRIADELDADKAYNMGRNVLTYHKLAMRIVRDTCKRNGAPEPELLSEESEEQSQIFEIARKAAGLTKESLKDDDARTMVSYAQNSLVNEIELASHIADWDKTKPAMAKFARFYLAYVAEIRKRNKIDFGEAIVRAVGILMDPAQAALWVNKFKWIFCDEYQDTTPAQSLMLQLIGQQANLFVVGDSAQSIYSWQGANPNNLTQFELDFPLTEHNQLSKNYRCFPKLVSMSSGFLQRAGEAHGVRIEHDQKRSTEEQKVYFLQSEDDSIEAKALAKLIKEALKIPIPGDPPPKANVGILARKWHLLSAIEEELIKEGIPYKFEGETARGIVVGKVLEIAREAAGIIDGVEGKRELTEETQKTTAKEVSEKKITTADALLRAVRANAPAAVWEAEERIGFNNLCTLLSGKSIGTISALCSPDMKYVVLSTVHSQKGEEFDTVIVIGLEEKNTPHFQPKTYQELLEWRKIAQALTHASCRKDLTDADLQKMYEQEEKRIFYVAMTRAKYNLVVAHAKERDVYGRRNSYTPSSFLGLAHKDSLVCETCRPDDLVFTGPKKSEPAGGYRTDGRIWETNAGVRVRSKSEVLLANEFTKLGIYFEYEETKEDVSYALPDFTFPDYGSKVILEHLGLESDPQYMENWNRKKKQYEAKGYFVCTTNEENIKNTSASVAQLQETFSAHVEGQQEMGAERAKRIKEIETIRQNSGDLKIGHHINKFEDGIFDANDINNQKIVAVAASWSKVVSGADSTILIPGVKKLAWEKRQIGAKEVLVGLSQ